jgi:hypothetical protein
MSAFTVINDIKNTLTACCASIVFNFDGTFTSLADIRSTLTALHIVQSYTVLDVLIADICNPTIITQATFGVGGAVPLVIATPGVYVLGEDVTFNPLASVPAITITTSAVTLDLSCFTLAQGNALAGVNAIQVASNNADVTIKNGTVANFTRTGISVLNGNIRTLLQNVTCLSCGLRGIELLGLVGSLIQSPEIDHCVVNECCQGLAGDFGIAVVVKLYILL